MPTSTAWLVPFQFRLLPGKAAGPRLDLFTCAVTHLSKLLDTRWMAIPENCSSHRQQIIARDVPYPHAVAERDFLSSYACAPRRAITANPVKWQWGANVAKPVEGGGGEVI